MVKLNRKSLAPPVDAGLRLRAQDWVPWLTPMCDDLLRGIARDALLAESSGDRLAEARVRTIAPLLSAAWNVLWSSDLETPPRQLQLKQLKMGRARQKGGRQCSAASCGS